MVRSKPLPEVNDPGIIVSLIYAMFIFAIKYFCFYLSIFLMGTGFLVTGIKIGKDIFQNKAPIVFYFFAEIMAYRLISPLLVN